jgi:hypothetical protein
MPVDKERALNIGIAALSFVANDEALLRRFLAVSGIDAAGIRAAAAEPGFLAGVLRFFAAHEPTLLAFCAESAIEPASILEAMRALPGGDDRYAAAT